MGINFGEIDMMNENNNNYREHNIEWDDEKVSRLWDYYSALLHILIYIFLNYSAGIC